MLLTNSKVELNGQTRRVSIYGVWYLPVEINYIFLWDFEIFLLMK